MCDYVVLYVPAKKTKTVLGSEHYQTLQKNGLWLISNISQTEPTQPYNNRLFKTQKTCQWV